MNSLNGLKQIISRCITDPRTGKYKKYKIENILILFIFANIMGANTYCDVARIVQYKYKLFSKLLKVYSGPPSHDTFARIISSLDPTELSIMLISLNKFLFNQSDVKQIALDGQRVRGSFDSKKNQDAVHIVTAFCTNFRVSLTETRVSNKTNEIYAFLDLLDNIDIQGVIVTIDAIGCQEKVTKQIIDKDGDYIIGLKDNQKKLWIQSNSVL